MSIKYYWRSHYNDTFMMISDKNMSDREFVYNVVTKLMERLNIDNWYTNYIPTYKGDDMELTISYTNDQYVSTITIRCSPITTVDNDGNLVYYRGS